MTAMESPATSPRGNTYSDPALSPAVEAHSMAGLGAEAETTGKSPGWYGTLLLPPRTHPTEVAAPAPPAPTAQPFLHTLPAHPAGSSERRISALLRASACAWRSVTVLHTQRGRWRAGPILHHLHLPTLAPSTTHIQSVTARAPVRRHIPTAADSNSKGTCNHPAVRHGQHQCRTRGGRRAPVRALLGGLPQL